MQLKKEQVILQVKSNNNPDPYKKRWRKTFCGELIPPSSWPNGWTEIIYFYFWLNGDATEPPNSFRPDDLIYLGERNAGRNFKAGWVIGEKNGPDKDRRYPWLPRVQNRRVFAVAYELPPAPKFSSDRETQGACRNQRRESLEYLVASDLVNRYGQQNRILEFTGGFTFRVAWLRASDVQSLARWILYDLKASYGV